MVIWVKSPIADHFSSLIPRMSMFTLAICFTTSNLPWFMDLTFQVPMQCCSSQHQTLLLSPITSTTGYCFCFHPFILSRVISPLISSSILCTYWLESSSFSILSFCLFIQFMGFSRWAYWSGFPFSSPVDYILSDLSTVTCSSWVAPQGMGLFHWVRQGCGPCDQIGYFSVIMVSVCLTSDDLS